MNRPPIRIHDHAVREGLTEKVRRIVAESEHQSRTTGGLILPSGVACIPIGTAPWGVDLVFSLATHTEERSREAPSLADDEAPGTLTETVDVVDVVPTTINALTALDAWYAKWPPEKCEPPHVVTWGEDCPVLKSAHLCHLEDGHAGEHRCTCGARSDGAEVTVHDGDVS